MGNITCVADFYKTVNGSFEMKTEEELTWECNLPNNVRETIKFGDGYENVKFKIANPCFLTLLSGELSCLRFVRGPVEVKKIEFGALIYNVKILDNKTAVFSFGDNPEELYSTPYIGMFCEYNEDNKVKIQELVKIKEKIDDLLVIRNNLFQTVPKIKNT